MADEKWRIRHNPFPLRPVRELEEMRRRFDEDFFQPAMHAIWERIPEGIKSWSPAVDVYEKGDNLTVKVEIAGMKLEDIDVNVTDEVLTIKGERKVEAGIKEDDFFRSEIACGAFYRSISLPFKIDIKSTEAVYEDGILTIKLLRAAGAKPEKVSIKIKKQPTEKA